MDPGGIKLAILPWENLSAQSSDEALVAGFVHDLITELARVPSFGVMGPDSTHAVSQTTKGGLEAAQQLGASYYVTGSVRRWGKATRINVRLVDARNGSHVWAGRYDGNDLPGVHDEITAKIVNALVSKVDQTLLKASRRRVTASLKAYECWLRGIDALQRGTAAADEEGRSYFEQALRDDPHYARAIAGISLSHFNEWSCQAWEQWGEKEEKAYKAALKAELLDADDAMVQLILGRIEQYRRKFSTALPRFERALRLAPNDSTILIQLAGCFTYHGHPERGLDLAHKAITLNPLGPGWFPVYAALPLFSLERFDEALTMSGKAPPKTIVDAPAYRAAAAAHLARTEEAAQHLEEFRLDFLDRIHVGKTFNSEELLHWVLHVNPYRRSEDRDRLESGLRKAGLGSKPSRTKSSALMNWKISNTFRREGTIWTLAYNGQAIVMPDLRGLHDIARLLVSPGEALAAVDLAGAILHQRGLETADPQALAAYRERLAMLEDEIAETAAAGNVTRAEHLEVEREALLQELKKVTGFAGRRRSSGGVDERSRGAVTWRIRHAIQKIKDLHPALGTHLARSIKTGAFCTYCPENPVEWH